MIDLDKLSPEAVEVYRRMVELMDQRTGFLDFSDCLEITVEGLEEGEGLDAIGSQCGELVAAALCFAAPEKSGWYVRFPVKQALLK